MYARLSSADASAMRASAIKYFRRMFWRSVSLIIARYSGACRASMVSVWRCRVIKGWLAAECSAAQHQQWSSTYNILNMLALPDGTGVDYPSCDLAATVGDGRGRRRCEAAREYARQRVFRCNGRHRRVGEVWRAHHSERKDAGTMHNLNEEERAQTNVTAEHGPLARCHEGAAGADGREAGP